MNAASDSFGARLQWKPTQATRTYAVSNGEFLLAVFGVAMTAALVDARPVVVSFGGNPANAAPKAWFGRPWRGDADMSTALPADANNYFSLAAFRPDEAGQYRRQKARFAGLLAVMLDDVGTKVAMERLTLPPSWLVETSPGNHQAGYLLNEPLDRRPRCGSVDERHHCRRAVRPRCQRSESTAGPATCRNERQAHATVCVSNGDLVA